MVCELAVCTRGSRNGRHTLHYSVQTSLVAYTCTSVRFRTPSLSLTLTLNRHHPTPLIDRFASPTPSLSRFATFPNFPPPSSPPRSPLRPARPARLARLARSFALSRTPRQSLPMSCSRKARRCDANRPAIASTAAGTRDRGELDLRWSRQPTRNKWRRRRRRSASSRRSHRLGGRALRCRCCVAGGFAEAAAWRCTRVASQAYEATHVVSPSSFPPRLPPPPLLRPAERMCGRGQVLRSALPIPLLPTSLRLPAGKPSLLWPGERPNHG